MLFPNIDIAEDMSVSGHFLHGIDLANGMVIHNLSLNGHLETPDLMGKIDSGLAVSYRDIGTISIEELKSSGPQGNVLSPRVARYFIPAAILDAGQTIVNGFGEPVAVSADRTIRTRDIEIDFEIGRRKFAPEAPSRLSCIWLAENSAAGRGAINKMVYGAYIADVKIVFCTGVIVADAGWFDDYTNDQKPEFIEKYWSRVRHPKESIPEILVGGLVKFSNPDQLQYIKKNGATLYEFSHKPLRIP